MTHGRTLTTPAGTGVLGTDAGGNLVLRRVLVRVVSGPDRGTQLMLEGGTIVLGSHPDADLTLNDSAVSRYHAEVAFLADGVRVRDLNSTNGTFAGSSRIESVVLVPATEIRVGRSRIELLPADLPAPEAPSESTRFGRLVGATPAMRRVFGVLERVAPTDAPILIEGEAGVGKTEAAWAVHSASFRREGPFVPVELTGGRDEESVRAAMAAAVGGTLVLERVDEAPAAMAAAAVSGLERVERGELDVRVLATSRTDMRARVEVGAAPRDLYFHVAAVRVVIPPLKERLDDLPVLVREIIGSLDYGDVPLGPAELAPLRGHDFPGNVRELARMIEQTLISARRPSTPPPAASVAVTDELVRIPFKDAKERLVDAFEREYVARLLARHDGNFSRAAAEAGLDRNYLARLAKKHSLR